MGLFLLCLNFELLSFHISFWLKNYFFLSVSFLTVGFLLLACFIATGFLVFFGGFVFASLFGGFVGFWANFFLAATWEMSSTNSKTAIGARSPTREGNFITLV